MIARPETSSPSSSPVTPHSSSTSPARALNFYLNEGSGLYILAATLIITLLLHFLAKVNLSNTLTIGVVMIMAGPMLVAAIKSQYITEAVLEWCRGWA